MKSTEKTVFEFALIAALLLALALLPMQAWSQNTSTGGPPSDKGPISFKTFDEDGDGQISEAEFNQARAERMASRAAEGRAMSGAKNMATFDSVDTDGNGTIDQAELQAHQQAHRQMKGGQGKGGQTAKKMPSFADMDTDGDGCISPDELEAHQRARHPQNF